VKLIGATNPADAEEGTIRKNMREGYEKMLYMVQILTKMLLLKLNFIFLKRDFLIIFPK
jgi:nucleoside diphosphate kinase